MCEFGLCGWLRVVISPESYDLWTWDLHHWIQQRLRFVNTCGSIVTTPSDLEQWAPRLNQYAWIWFTWVNSYCHISWTLLPMDMRLAPLDTTKMEVYNYKDVWIVTTPSALELCAAAISTFMDFSSHWRCCAAIHCIYIYVSWRLQTINSDNSRLPHGPWNFVPVKVIIVWLYPCSLCTISSFNFCLAHHGLVLLWYYQERMSRRSLWWLMHSWYYYISYSHPFSIYVALNCYCCLVNGTKIVWERDYKHVVCPIC